MPKVCVLGLGYIGLPTASVLATNGFDVVGIDVAEHVVATVSSGHIHIEEPGLATVVQAAIHSGKLRAAYDPEPADIHIIAVPTPLTKQKTADMTYVRRAAETLVPHLRAGTLVILESTSPPGTCRDLVRPILEQSGLEVGKDLHLAYCPERVLPGKILTELIQNDRIIGGYDRESAERARDIYARFVEGELFLTDATTAEMVKLLENTYRDVNIALANEASRICETLGVDFWEVSRYANRHPRVHIHSAGPGVGGHCISVDPWFLVEKAPEQARLIRLARTCNDAMPDHVVAVLKDLVAAVAEPKVALLGLAYKDNVDDLRESPALRVAQLLEAAGIAFQANDPLVKQAPVTMHPVDTCLDGADCLLLLAGHDAYRQMLPEDAARRMRTPVLFDTRNALDHPAWTRAGFHVRVLGAGS